MQRVYEENEDDDEERQDKEEGDKPQSEERSGMFTFSDAFDILFLEELLLIMRGLTERVNLNPVVDLKQAQSLRCNP